MLRRLKKLSNLNFGVSKLSYSLVGNNKKISRCRSICFALLNCCVSFYPVLSLTELQKLFLALLFAKTIKHYNSIYTQTQPMTTVQTGFRCVEITIEPVMTLVVGACSTVAHELWYCGTCDRRPSSIAHVRHSGTYLINDRRDRQTFSFHTNNRPHSRTYI